MAEPAVAGVSAMERSADEDAKLCASNLLYLLPRGGPDAPSSYSLTTNLSTYTTLLHTYILTLLTLLGDVYSRCLEVCLPNEKYQAENGISLINNTMEEIVPTVSATTVTEKIFSTSSALSSIFVSAGNQEGIVRDYYSAPATTMDSVAASATGTWMPSYFSFGGVESATAAVADAQLLSSSPYSSLNDYSTSPIFFTYSSPTVSDFTSFLTSIQSFFYEEYRIASHTFAAAGNGFYETCRPFVNTIMESDVFQRTQSELMFAYGVIVHYLPELNATWYILFSFLLASYLFHTLHHRILLTSAPRILSQHLGASYTTQTIPQHIQLDVTTPGSVFRAVYETVREGTFADLIRQVYTPSKWLSLPFIHGDVQTLLTGMGSNNLLRTPFITYKREYVEVTAQNEFLFGGQIALDWCCLGKERCNDPLSSVYSFHSIYTTHTPTVLILHGLAGGSSEHYVKNLCYYLSVQKGYRCVVMNARGCGGSELISQQLYCGAYTEDLRQVVKSIKSRLPYSPLCAVGFSLGANILTKYVGEEGLIGTSPFTSVVALSNPFDFLLGSKYLESSWLKKKYSKALAGNLCKLLRKHVEVLSGEVKKENVGEMVKEEEGQQQQEGQAIEQKYSSPSKSHPQLNHHDSNHRKITHSPDGTTNVEDGNDSGDEDNGVMSTPNTPPPDELVSDETGGSTSSSLNASSTSRFNFSHVFSSPSLREFDKRFTCVGFGYSTVDDYYRDATSSRFVKFIRCPTLFINALDDPISWNQSIPVDEISINPYCTALLTNAGGHSMDFYSGGSLLGALFGYDSPKSWAIPIIAEYMDSILMKLGLNEGIDDTTRKMPCFRVVTPPRGLSEQQETVMERWNEFVQVQRSGRASPAPEIEEQQQLNGVKEEEQDKYAKSWETAGKSPSKESISTTLSPSTITASSITDLHDSVEQAMKQREQLEEMERSLYQLPENPLRLTGY